MTRFSEAGDSAPNRTARLSAGRSSSSCSPITAPGQVPERGPARVQAPELAREPGQAPELVPAQGPGQASQARGPACWRPAAQPGRAHARRRFCQRHNTQQWPG
ncbi:hypothetical protein MPL3365_150172 [Mesorhizobium plurifarium]|uniref:Uncharacterized protein n=1 Tax=Mesorhizobium plurifarium TaxID=69974 RepID=A0A090G4Z8_MESPL|nr:hypothetical protein MPL3365_150172 [Mesorhizobium plurifarium]